MKALLSLLAAVLIVSTGGCRLSSKWAMDDPDYAAKYGRPYTERGLRRQKRIAKQIVDARFLQDKTGLYAEAAFQDDPARAGGTIGIIHYPEPFVSLRGGLAGVIRDGEDGHLAGVDGGVRFHVPARLSPYAGFGGFAGYHKDEITITVGGAPSPEPVVPPLPTSFEESQQMSTDGGLAAIYPEVGANFWINGHVSLNASAKYFVVTDGRNFDFWFFGVGITWLFGPKTSETSVLEDIERRKHQAAEASETVQENIDAAEIDAPSTFFIEPPAPSVEATETDDADEPFFPATDAGLPPIE